MWIAQKASLVGCTGGARDRGAYIVFARICRGRNDLLIAADAESRLKQINDSGNGEEYEKRNDTPQHDALAIHFGNQ